MGRTIRCLTIVMLLVAGSASLGAPSEGAGALTLDPAAPGFSSPQESSGGFWRLQVGLQGAAQASDATRFPAYQLVDYVRIWDRPFDFLTTP